MMPRAKRRWLSWSLRRMFVVVTVLRVWFGWNVNQVNDAIN
jgi:hypothetical protein